MHSPNAEIERGVPLIGKSEQLQEKKIWMLVSKRVHCHTMEW